MRIHVAESIGHKQDLEDFIYGISNFVLPIITCVTCNLLNNKLKLHVFMTKIDLTIISKCIC